MTTSHGSSMSMARHPDIVALRDRYDTIGGTPQVQVAEGLLFLAGGYAAFSPWVVGFNTVSPALAITNLIAGVAAMVLTLGFAMSYGRTHGMAWVAPVIGIWLIVAPWAVQGTDRTTNLIVSNAIVGGCVIVFGFAMMAFAARMRGFGRD
jgi:hypothetical protein